MNGEDLVGGLTPQQREAMGLTRANVRKVARQLRKEGRLKGLSQREMAELILDVIAVDNPKAFAAPNIDWDALIAFIEKLLPLILKLIELFS